MKKLALFVREVLEVYIPTAAFIFLFLAFILQVFFRYVVNHPLTWTQDVIVIGFCWSVILGACYTMRRKGHVQFTMLYEAYSPKVAAWARLIGNILIIITFAVMVVPYTWIFLPFTYFLLAIIGYSIKPVIEDWKVITGKLADSFDHSYDPLLGEVKK